MTSSVCSEIQRQVYSYILISDVTCKKEKLFVTINFSSSGCSLKAFEPREKLSLTCYLRIDCEYVFVVVVDTVMQQIPRGRKSNVFCVLDDTRNVHLRLNGKKSVYEDECGVWDSSQGRTTKFPYLVGAGGELKRLFLRNNETAQSVYVYYVMV